MRTRTHLGALSAFFLALLAAACGVVSGGDDCPAEGFPQGSCSSPGKMCGELDACGNGTAAVCEGGEWIVNSYDEDCGCSQPCPTTCPDTQPVDLSPCEGEGASCTFDDPTCAGSQMAAVCSSGVWRVGHVGLTCPADCPAALPDHQSACVKNGVDCTFPDPSCAETGMEALCEGGVWQVGPFDRCAATCPASLPASGSACGGCCEASACSYLDATGCAVQAVCDGAAWQQTAEACASPLSTCAKLDAAACSAASGCRWLEHAPCATVAQTFPQGCYPVEDCTGSASCPGGTTCQLVEANPCPSVNCDACSFQTSLCAP